MLRDGSTGRFVGRLDDSVWFHNDDVHWVDYKESDVRFPNHNKNMNGKVHTYNIKDSKNN